MPEMRPSRSIKRDQQCIFCTSNVKVIDYKDAEMLRKYLNPQGKIATRRRTGVCAKHQRIMGTAIKRARHLALLPFMIR